MPCLIWFVFQPVIYRYQKLLPYSLSFFNLSTVAHIWPSRLFKLLGFLFHQFFGPPKNVFGPPTLVAAVGDFKEGGVDDAGSQRADRQCTYSSRRGRRQAREWRDKGAPSALLAAIVPNLKISWKYVSKTQKSYVFIPLGAGSSYFVW